MERRKPWEIEWIDGNGQLNLDRFMLTEAELNEKTENIQQDGGEVLNVEEVDRV